MVSNLLPMIAVLLALPFSQAQFMAAPQLNQPAGPVHPGFQEMPVYGNGPEAELRKALHKQTQGSDPLGYPIGGPFPPDNGYVKPYFGSFDDITKRETEKKACPNFVERLQLFMQGLGNNYFVCFCGYVWDWAKNVEIREWVKNVEIRWTGICTAIASMLVVMCGIVPAILMPIETGNALHQPAGLRKLKRLLSFAVGSLLGDVFLHILPEAYSGQQFSSLGVGLWIIAGLLLCFLVEKICSKSEESQHRVTAFMNLVANLIDNFTHGLAVGGSFLVNIKFGFLTTFAILVHEIPHEISDFAILLRADFNRWQAVKAQLVTASGGVLGAIVAVWMNENAALNQRASWILPFTAGGFLNIALVEILPDLMRESNGRESIKQLLLLLLGIGVMGAINLLHFSEF